jgi:hypothetical protein
MSLAIGASPELIYAYSGQRAFLEVHPTPRLILAIGGHSFVLLDSNLISTLIQEIRWHMRELTTRDMALWFRHFQASYMNLPIVPRMEPEVVKAVMAKRA